MDFSDPEKSFATLNQHSEKESSIKIFNLEFLNVKPEDKEKFEIVIIIIFVIESPISLKTGSKFTPST